MNVIHRAALQQVELVLAVGDLFDAKVDAIVNSEQTDFILSKNPESVSGQIWRRYGETVQRELDAATNGRVLGAGTVIDTSGGHDFVRIFHAGFHDAHDWGNMPGIAWEADRVPSESKDAREADYFAAIGSCTAQILDAAVAQKVKSVAFPLIGCGLFGLDEKMLVLQFLDTIDELDDRLTKGETLQVWLVIRDRLQFESVAGVFFDLVMQMRSKMVSVRVRHTGMPMLDRFATRLVERTNEDWAKWQICRYAEIGTELMCYGIIRAIRYPMTPESLFDEDRAPTFGLFRDLARRIAATENVEEDGWGAHFFARVVKDKTAARALETVVAQRNNLAHGRQSLPLSKIKKLVTQGLELESWERIPETDGELRLVEWRPWVEMPSTRTNLFGLFERWQKNTLSGAGDGRGL